MFCSNCGKAIEKSVNFCPYCGNKIKENTEAEIESFPEKESVEFNLAGRKLVFAANVTEYARLRVRFADLAKNNQEEFNRFYEPIDHSFYRLFHMELPKFTEYINETVKFAVSVLIEYGIDYIDCETLAKKAEKDIHMDYALESITKDLGEVEKYAKRLAKDLEYSKNSRSPWSAYGEGIVGAIQGAMDAAILNMGHNALASIGDTFTTVSGKNEIKKMQNDVAKNSSTIYSMTHCLYPCCMGVFEAVIKILVDGGKIAAVNFNYKARNRNKNYLSLYQENSISLDDLLDKLCSSVQECPIDHKLYVDLYSVLAGSKAELNDLVKFFGISINYWSSINDFAKEKDKEIEKAKALPSDTAEQIEKKVAELNRIKKTCTGFDYEIEKIADLIENLNCKKLALEEKTQKEEAENEKMKLQSEKYLEPVRAIFDKCYTYSLPNANKMGFIGWFFDNRFGNSCNFPPISLKSTSNQNNLLDSKQLFREMFTVDCVNELWQEVLAGNPCAENIICELYKNIKIIFNIADNRTSSQRSDYDKAAYLKAYEDILHFLTVYSDKKNELAIFLNKYLNNFGYRIDQRDYKLDENSAASILYEYAANGVGADRADRIKYYEMAAQKLYPSALREMGYIYASGSNGYTKDLDKAKHYFRIASIFHSHLSEEELEKMQRPANQGSGGCFITSAVCKALGSDDDCYELNAFRRFRDNWLMKQPNGPRLIKEYYDIAPEIVRQIDLRPDSSVIYAGIWSNHLLKCLQAIETKRFDLCSKLYEDMVLLLKKTYGNT